jgi:NADH-quinone oxidoreductase subunit M
MESVVMHSFSTLAFLDGLTELFRSANDIPSLNTIILLLAILTPLCSAVALMTGGRASDFTVRVVAMLGFIASFAGSTWLFFSYQALVSDGGYAFEFLAPTGLEFIGIHLYLGLNGISAPLFWMAGIVGFAAGLYALYSQVERLRLYAILLLVMQTGLMGLFASIDVFFFYFFHEFALIPTFIMIAMFGGRGRKGVALEMTIYLTAGAMLTLIGLVALYVMSGASSFDMIALRDAVANLPAEKSIYGLLLIGFGILVSLFPFHSWAPKGYATAPASAAMLHAGVLKKFGLYGLIQIALPLLPEGREAWAPVLMWLALGNVVFIGFVTIAQRDLKMMLGNASVMHMGYAFLGLFAYSVVGIGGTVMMLFAHGLSIALLFLLSDVIERRAGTTEFVELGGMAKSAPVLMSFFVAATMASIGLPGFANFWGELSIFIALFKSSSPWVIYPAVVGIVISAIYGLRAVARVFFGEAKHEYSGGDITLTEKLPALILLLALFLVGFWPRLFSDNLNAAVKNTGVPEAPMSVVEVPITPHH